jgi:hypothetical protein
VGGEIPQGRLTIVGQHASVIVRGR